MVFAYGGAAQGWLVCVKLNGDEGSEGVASVVIGLIAV